jgi:hypothetical protein
VADRSQEGLTGDLIIPPVDRAPSPEVAAWLDALPADLARHVRILRLAIADVTSDERLIALQVQGSVGRGTADRHSDLDLGLVVDDASWPAIAAEVPAKVIRWGEVVDGRNQLLPSPDAPDALSTWMQFADGIQLDLLVVPTSRFLGSGPDGKTLFDPHEVILPTDHPQRLTDIPTVSKWALTCWQSLTETAKYLERGLPLTALEWLNPARQATISCWAAAHGLEFAGFANVVAGQLGIKSPWPAGLEKTYATPDPMAVLKAARELAKLQSQVDGLLGAQGLPPRPLAQFVRARLAVLEVAASRQRSRPERRSRPGTKPGVARQSARPRAAPRTP